MSTYTQLTQEERYQIYALMKAEQAYNEFSETCSSRVNHTLIWGDSHAAALASGWREVNEHVSQFTASGCPPIIGQKLSSGPRSS